MRISRIVLWVCLFSFHSFVSGEDELPGSRNFYDIAKAFMTVLFNGCLKHFPFYRLVLL